MQTKIILITSAALIISTNNLIIRMTQLIH